MSALLPTLQRGTRLRSARGFTLAEIAITIVIVGIGLMLVLQGLNTAKLTAAHTRNMKVARELGLLTLGRIAAGEYQEDVESGMADTYADEGFPDFMYEVVLGDDAFVERESDGRFDNWDPDLYDNADEDEDEEDAEQPYEKVKVRVTYPAIRDMPNQLSLEQWVPWRQVYGEDEDEVDENEEEAAGA
jgi:prepilin-type N-terminal cleavage/methylation domain-containing protein